MYAPPGEQPSPSGDYLHRLVSCVGFALRLCCCINREDELSLGEGHGSRANLLEGRDRRLLSNADPGTIETTFTPPRSPELEHRAPPKGAGAQQSPPLPQWHHHRPPQRRQQQQEQQQQQHPGGSRHERSGSGGSDGSGCEGGGESGSPGNKAAAGKLGKGGKTPSAFSLLEDDELCPTCLEPYTEENPAVVTRCGHSFHLPCIYEWLERSETCPMCGREMHFEEVL